MSDSNLDNSKDTLIGIENNEPPHIVAEGRITPTKPRELTFSPEIYRNLNKIKKGAEFQMILEDSKIDGAMENDKFLLIKKGSSLKLEASYRKITPDNNLPRTHSRVIFIKL